MRHRFACTGAAFHPQLEFDVEQVSLRTGLATLYIQEMAKRGCHGYPSFYLNAAQGAAEVEQTLAAARETFTLLAVAAERGTVAPWLECEHRSDPFRRLVR